jgi:hypothetical protein
MADTDQAAAGAETAEPGGLGPRRPLPGARHLLAYLPAPPEALRELPRRARADLTEHAGSYLAGVRSGLAVGVCGWLVAAALTLSLWAAAAPAGADPWVPVRVSGQLWLASHHVLMHAADGPFGLSPLGFTLLPLLGLFAAGRRVARRVPERVPRATFGAAAGYAVVACAVAAGSSDVNLHPEYAQVLFYPALLALIGHGAGAADAIRELIPNSAARIWPPHAARGALAALCVWLAAAAFAAAAALVVHADALARVRRETGGGAVGEAGLLLIDLALVPNALLWAGGVLVGPGFTLGTGTSVTVFAVSRGPLPGLPLLAGTPGSQHPSAWWLSLLLLPPAAGAVGAWVITRSVRGWSELVGSAAAMAALCGVAVGVLELYAGGPLAFGPMSVVGSTAWLVGILAGLEVGLGAGVVLALRRYLRAPAAGWWRWGGGREPGVRLVDGCEVVSADDDDLGAAELVGDGLPLVVPQRQEEPDTELEQVGQGPDDGAVEAEDLPVGLPHQPDPDGLHAEGLAAGALPAQLPEPDEERVERADAEAEQPDAGEAAVQGGVGGDDDGLGGDAQQDASGPGGQQHEQVHQGGADALTPGGEGEGT